MKSRVMTIKDLLPYRARVVLGRVYHRLCYWGEVLTLKSPGNFRCPVCEHKLVSFVHGGKLCPYCTSFPRHRMFWPLLSQWIDSAKGQVHTLLVAPDISLRRRLREQTRVIYHGIDKFTPGHYYPPDTVNGDITDLNYAEASFDLVICSHVLEHVPNDKRALEEIYRVLLPGGLALIAFPFRAGQLTYEDESIVDPAGRARAFGQWDHVRFYGEDVAKRMESAGFESRKLTPLDFYELEKISQFGLQPDEAFFVCRKPGISSSLSDVF